LPIPLPMKLPFWLTSHCFAHPFYPQLPGAQNYTFNLRCDDDCALFIDGSRVLEASVGNPTDATIFLPDGQHSFKVGLANAIYMMLSSCGLTTSQHWALAVVSCAKFPKKMIGVNPGHTCRARWRSICQPAMGHWIHGWSGCALEQGKPCTHCFLRVVLEQLV
jgi:hypothetical protein